MKRNLFAIIGVILLLQACSGVRSFPNTARAGDTVALATGIKKDFRRDNITVIITPSSGSPVAYLPGNPAVRAVVNLYPDPLSSILVSDELRRNLTPYAVTYADQMNINFTNGDKDWWQTTVFIDLDSTIAEGPAAIDIVSQSGETFSTLVDVVAGTGQSDSLEAELNGPLYPNQLISLERVSHYEVGFTGDVIPYALQIIFSHDLDDKNGGSGSVYVVNPRGDIKSVNWTDAGNELHVLLMPSQLDSFNDFNDFKFYIAGGVTGLVVQDVVAVDVNGGPVSGVIPDIIAR